MFKPKRRFQGCGRTLRTLPFDPGPALNVVRIWMTYVAGWMLYPSYKTSSQVSCSTSSDSVQHPCLLTPAPFITQFVLMCLMPTGLNAFLFSFTPYVLYLDTPHITTEEIFRFVYIFVECGKIVAGFFDSSVEMLFQLIQCLPVSFSSGTLAAPLINDLATYLMMQLQYSIKFYAVALLSHATLQVLDLPVTVKSFALIVSRLAAYHLLNDTPVSCTFLI